MGLRAQSRQIPRWTPCGSRARTPSYDEGAAGIRGGGAVLTCPAREALVSGAHMVPTPRLPSEQIKAL